MVAHRVEPFNVGFQQSVLPVYAVFNQLLELLHLDFQNYLIDLVIFPKVPVVFLFEKVDGCLTVWPNGLFKEKEVETLTDEGVYLFF
jgi:hypothetical protein